MGEQTRVEPGPGQESVWDYPTPPTIEPSKRRLEVVLDGVVVAATERGVRVLEARHGPAYYFPPDDVRSEHLRPADLRTHCPWKGDARYFDVVVGDRVASEAAWAYPHPYAEFEELRDWIAFYPPKVDACRVDGVEAWGDLFGGWITPELVGPFRRVEDGPPA